MRRCTFTRRIVEKPSPARHFRSFSASFADGCLHVYRRRLPRHQADRQRNLYVCDPAGSGRPSRTGGVAKERIHAALRRCFWASVGSVILCKRGNEGDGASVAVKRVTIGFVDRAHQAQDGLSDIDSNRGGREATICHELKQASGGRYIVQLLGARGRPPRARKCGRGVSRQNRLPDRRHGKPRPYSLPSPTCPGQMTF